MRYIVDQGEATELSREELEHHNQDDYGMDWIVIEANSPDEAIAQANLYDNGQHPAQTEMMMFQALARNAGTDTETDEEQLDALYDLLCK